MAESLEPAVYRVAEVARLLDMGERQTREAIRRGEIPCHPIGGRWRCSKVAIHAWLDGAEPNGRHGGKEVMNDEDPTDRRAAVGGNGPGNVRRACGAGLQVLEVGERA